MKKIFALALIALATTTTAFADPNSVSTKVLSHVATSFKQATNISWVANDRFDKISFTLNNEKVDAFYNTYGELIGTSKTMAFDKLPKAAIETITTKYTFPKFQLKDCIQFTGADNEANYYVSMDADYETLVLEISKNGSVKIFNRARK